MLAYFLVLTIIHNVSHVPLQERRLSQAIEPVTQGQTVNNLHY